MKPMSFSLGFTYVIMQPLWVGVCVGFGTDNWWLAAAAAVFASAVISAIARRDWR